MDVKVVRENEDATDWIGAVCFDHEGTSARLWACRAGFGESIPDEGVMRVQYDDSIEDAGFSKPKVSVDEIQMLTIMTSKPMTWK